MPNYDFSGWATRNNLVCADGRVIMHNAFADCDGETVPLVWNHDHGSVNNILGKALLENREDGVYAYGSFNDTEAGRTAKETLRHGDIVSLSIFANKLKETGYGIKHVEHGKIREVSLVLAGANPGAYIENVAVHGSDEGECAEIYTGIEIEIPDESVIEHADDSKEDTKVADEKTNGKTPKEIYDTLNEEQKNLFAIMVGLALEDKKGNSNNSTEGESNMKHNVFDDYGSNYQGNDTDGNVLTHADFTAAMEDLKRYGSLKESFLQHGIEGIEDLFPEPKVLNNPPEWINVKTDWVPRVMNGVHHNPVSRIKSSFADITGEEARALGYIKGKYKKEEVFTLLKRTTAPTTIYKKQKFDRDDVVDITDFDVIPWIKKEMRGKLDEELARAFLIGDGRLTDSDDHINEGCIRPIWKDEDLFTIKYTLADSNPETFIRGAIKSRIDYRGSGSPVLFMTEDELTDMLLLTDATGRDLYESEQKLATKMRVSSIITVPVMANAGVRTDAKTGKQYKLHGLIVNLNDYYVGTDKGGQVTMFDDFDIDYNKMIYLIETRCSGALVKPYSAIALETEIA